VTASARGSGPGAITADGCAVELYALLPANGEPDIVHAAVGAGATILELGAGAGRMTHPLLALGHPVVAVDESAEMLAHIRGARTVQSRIETLALGERFDAVLLASHLVNTPDDAARQALLRTCRTHVRDSGRVIVQRHDPTWFDTAAPSKRTQSGITFELAEVSRPGPDLIEATMRYEAAGRTWAQHFTARRIDDEALGAALSTAGLVLDAWLIPDRTWVSAMPSLSG
jgi:SAM-dependent methyltransferase